MAKKHALPQHGGARANAGRKQAHTEGKAVVVTASVPSGLVERMAFVADVKGWNRSQAITEAIRLLLKHYEKKLKTTIPSGE